MSVRRIRTPEAFAALYEPHRYKVFYGGRGGAKSTAFADALLAQADSRPMRILCAREIQKSIRESVHQLLADRARAGGYPYEVKNTEIVHPNGSRFFFEGLWQNIDSIKSIEGVDVCWVEEANTVSEESLDKLDPTIRKPGSEIWFSFNPELKSDPVYQRFVVTPPPNAYVKKVSWRDNPWFTDEMRVLMDHQQAQDYEKYLHIWEGELKSFADGAIYGKELRKAREDGRITDVPVANGQPVHTAWDLGKNDHTAIWFLQVVGPQIRVIDYYESRLEDLDHYARVLKKRDYLYGTHYLPHDAEHDILGLPETRRQMLERMGVKPTVIVPRVPHINDGIELTRKMLGSMWFDKTRCEKGLDALAAYEYLYDDKYRTHRERPAHTWASNGADALRQFAQGWKGASLWTEVAKPQGRRAEKMSNWNNQASAWMV